MTLTRQFQDQFRASNGEIPQLSLRKRSFFQPGYYVMAVWGDGTALKVARFHDKLSAQYWIDVEGADWTERCAAPLGAMAAA
jgi:hypothetical protein